MESVSRRLGGAQLGGTLLVGTLRGRGRELAVLAAGLAAGAALAWAGATVHDGLRTASDVAVARLSGTLADTVVAEWERMLRASEPPVAPGGEAFRFVDEHLLEPLELREPAPVPGALSVFETLLAEAERRELALGDLEGALDLVLEALAKEPDAPRRSEGWLRALQLGLRLERPDLVAAYAERLHSLDLTEARDGIPYRLLASLALGEGLGSRGARSVALTELERLYLDQDRLTLGPPEDPVSRFELAPMLAALCARLGLEPPPLERRKARALALQFAVPEVEDDGRWHLVEVGGRPFVLRRTGAEQRGWFHDPREIQRALSERAALPAGFALDFEGASETLGVALRPRTSLPDSPHAFTLRHPDPAALGRAESSRLRLLRGALFVLAFACAAGGFLTARVLARQRKLAELKSAFIAGVSHDLRTPLASILLLTENLDTGVAEGADRERYHRALRKEATRLRRLVDDVLDFSRLERGAAPSIEREGLDLGAFAAELEAEARSRVEGEGRAFLSERGPMPETATLDAHAVRRALENLLDNALKHGSGTVRLAIASANGRLTVAVADEGPGVPEAERERVFEPFERLQDPHAANGHAGGTGLGLAIVRSIARAHGGEARVRADAASGGAVFELELPLEEVSA